MAYIPRSSFSQPPSAIPEQIRKRHTVHIFSLVGTIMLVCSVISVGGVFLYKQYLEKELDSLKGQLSALDSGENDRKMLEIQQYDQKLNIAQTLLDNHIAISRLFDTLGLSTKETVRFKGIDYKYDPGFDAEVKLSGDTRELQSVALQKMQFFKDNIFEDFVVQNISMASPETEIEGDQKNKGVQGQEIVDLGVSFDVHGQFNKESISFTGDEKVSSTRSADTTNAPTTGTVTPNPMNETI
jgi:2-hydroxy-3-keto-5-methylthiopentenyl-1-phosphate phosphatase